MTIYTDYHFEILKQLEKEVEKSYNSEPVWMKLERLERERKEQEMKNSEFEKSIKEMNFKEVLINVRKN